MSKAIKLNSELAIESELTLPESFKDINAHNLYLYVKSYLSSQRANSAHTQSRGDVSGGGKKPWRQKGGGRARAGSITSPVFVGGGVAFGPKNIKNYDQKINKKQKKLAFKCAIADKASQGKLFVVDSVNIESGKTKDASLFLSKLNNRDVLIVVNTLNEKNILAFRNLKNCYVCDLTELNPYLIAVYSSVIIEKDVFANIVKEG
jgi:large subunit ribosomal protein L4